MPAGNDYVLIVRPGLPDAVAANGFEWLGERVDEVSRHDEGGGLMYRLGVAAVWLYRVTFGALFPTTCKYHPSCSQYAIDAVRTKGLLRGSLLAGWRLLRCNPVEPWRVRPGPMIVAFPLITPLEHVARHILNWLHFSVGLPWAWSIVALTVIVRMLLVPLTVKQIHSMQSLQRHAPQMKEIQKKYKGDKAKQNEELMKFYKENQINPAASCLPMLAQFPVFIALYYSLRAFSHEPASQHPGSLSFLHFIPSIADHTTSPLGRLRAARRVRRQSRWRRRSTCRRPRTRRSARSSCSCRSCSSS